MRETFECKWVCFDRDLEQEKEERGKIDGDEQENNRAGSSSGPLADDSLEKRPLWKKLVFKIGYRSPGARRLLATIMPGTPPNPMTNLSFSPTSDGRTIDKNKILN